MKNYKKDLVERVINLYNMYEEYMWRHNDVRLNILIQENMITFYLYNDNSEIDNIILSFSGSENKLYQYISIKILLRMIDDVIVHRDENEFHNIVLKPYLRLIVNDDDVFKIMKNIVDKQLLGIEKENFGIVKEIEDSVVNPLFYPNRVMKKLDERIGISKKLLRTGVVV